MLENAKYHLVYSAEVPKVSKMKKAEASNTAFPIQGRQIGSKDDCEGAQSHCSCTIEDKEDIEIIKLTKAKGHAVLFIPPYHSDLKLIDLLITRAQIKGNVG